MGEQKITIGCSFCFRLVSTKSCSCKLVRYCSKVCQKNHWPVHRRDVDHKWLSSKPADESKIFIKEVTSHYNVLLKYAMYDKKSCLSYSALAKYAKECKLSKREYMLKYVICVQGLKKSRILTIWKQFVRDLAKQTSCASNPFCWDSPKNEVSLTLSPKSNECPKSLQKADCTAHEKLFIQISFGKLANWVCINLHQ